MVVRGGEAEIVNRLKATTRVGHMDAHTHFVRKQDPKIQGSPEAVIIEQIRIGVSFPEGKKSFGGSTVDPPRADLVCLTLSSASRPSNHCGWLLYSTLPPPPEHGDRETRAAEL